MSSVMKFACFPASKNTRQAFDFPCTLTKSTIAVASMASEDTLACMLMLDLLDRSVLSVASDRAVSRENCVSKCKRVLYFLLHLRHGAAVQSEMRWLLRKQFNQSNAFLQLESDLETINI